MREQFTGKIGYVLAAAGSAVGLGNIWRFPYLAAKYGGGIFLLTYLILVLTFGYTLLIAENCIGRMTGKGPIGAFRDLCKNKTGFLKSLQIGGWINAIVSLIIVPYYCVIGGWVAKYVMALTVNPVSAFAKDVQVMDASGTMISASSAYFNSFIGSTWEPLFYFLLFVLSLAAVVVMGVKKGVERFNKILMPPLFLMLLGICVYCCFLPNAGEGFRYYLVPEPERFSYMTVVSAAEQLFYSLSIAMGIMITYGSYMRKENNLIANVNQVEFYDTLVAFLAGMIIIPAVVAFGGKAAAESAGIGLVFITMPQVFAEFSGGRIVGVFFFLLVLFAAATSAISFLETNVHTLMQEAKINRIRATILVVLEILCIGTLTILGYSVLKEFHPLAWLKGYECMNILESLDFISNGILMPIGAIFTTILVVAVIGLKKFTQEAKQGHRWYREYLFCLCVTVFVIPCLLIILLQAIGILH